MTGCVDIDDNTACDAPEVALKIHILGRTIDKIDAISRNDLVYISKIRTKAGPEEHKFLLGWILNTKRLLVSLSEEKYISWCDSIDNML